jgi:hypothetical protein
MTTTDIQKTAHLSRGRDRDRWGHAIGVPLSAPPKPSAARRSAE